eukprot:152949_1
MHRFTRNHRAHSANFKRYFSLGPGTAAKRSTGIRKHLLSTGAIMLTAAGVYGYRQSKSPKSEENEELRKIREKNSSWLVYVFLNLPVRQISRLWGNLASQELPVWMREPVYRLWAFKYNSNLDEVPDELSSFRSLSEFFARPLWISGDRPMAQNADVVSPVDGRVLICGPVEDDLVEQVKGVTFSLKQLLGEEPVKKHSGGRLHYIVLYLAPGDYHRIHAPMEWVIKSRRHFPGSLFPVAPGFARRFPNLFSVNERIALSGAWPGGYCAVVPVGAFNVGNIELSSLIEPDLKTNVPSQDNEDSWDRSVSFLDYTYEEHYGVQQSRGEYIGKFNLGSTVVIIFETPSEKDFRFRVKPEDRVRVGQEIGVIVGAREAEESR